MTITTETVEKPQQVTLARCDTCGVTVELWPRPYGIHLDNDAPYGWFTLRQHVNPASSVKPGLTKHFCSRVCLRGWANEAQQA